MNFNDNENYATHSLVISPAISTIVKVGGLMSEVRGQRSDVGNQRCRATEMRGQYFSMGHRLHQGEMGTHRFWPKVTRRSL